MDVKGTFVRSAVDYDDWHSSSDNFINQDCVIIQGIGNAPNCDDGSFICNRPITTLETDNFIHVNLRNIDSMTWTEANNYCINNGDQNTESVEIYEAFDEINMWVGIHDTVSYTN